MKLPPRSSFAAPVFCTLVLAAALAASACKPAPAAVPPATAKEQTYEIRGRITGFSPGRDTVTIQHENVPGFMPAMTMPFEVRAPALLAGTKEGDAIAFRFVVREDDSWIDRVTKIDPRLLVLPAAASTRAAAASSGGAPARLREGDQLPDFKLIDQDGRALTQADFAGKPLVFTFIFTRCPVPNFCPRLAHHFAELQRRFAAEGRRGVRLLSITIDPGFDQPEILKAYAQAHGADPAVWAMAVGSRAQTEQLTRAFAVRVEPEAGTLSHGLCTVLVRPDGTIQSLWRGNGWSPDEVLAAVAALP